MYKPSGSNKTTTNPTASKTAGSIRENVSSEPGINTEIIADLNAGLSTLESRVKRLRANGITRLSIACKRYESKC